MCTFANYRSVLFKALNQCNETTVFVYRRLKRNACWRPTITIEAEIAPCFPQRIVTRSLVPFSFLSLPLSFLLFYSTSFFNANHRDELATVLLAHLSLPFLHLLFTSRISPFYLATLYLIDHILFLLVLILSPNLHSHDTVSSVSAIAYPISVLENLAMLKVSKPILESVKTELNLTHKQTNSHTHLSLEYNNPTTLYMELLILNVHDTLYLGWKSKLRNNYCLDVLRARDINDEIS